MSSYWLWEDEGVLCLSEAPDSLSDKQIAHYSWSDKKYYTCAQYNIMGNVLHFNGIKNKLCYIPDNDWDLDSLFVRISYSKKAVKDYMDSCEVPENMYEIIEYPTLLNKIGIKKYCAKVKSRYYIEERNKQQITTSNFRIMENLK